MKTYDALVVGAGPVGSFISGKIAEQGHSALMIEEHHEIGQPMQCAGLISPGALKLSGAGTEVQCRIKGGHIHPPEGLPLELSSDETKCVVIDRCDFDKDMARNAAAKGVDISLGTSYRDFKKNDDGTLTVKTMENGSMREVRTRLIIGADGIGSAVAGSFSILHEKEVLSGFEAEVAGIEMDIEKLDVFTGTNIAPGFFAWSLPTDEHSARIGLCISDNSDHDARTYLNTLVKERFPEGKIVRMMAGAVPIGLAGRTYADNMMLAGDAACQVKPVSGGGIYTGLRSAEHCARTAIETLGSGNLSAGALSGYQKAWMEDIGGEIKAGLMVRKVMRRMTDKDLNEIIKVLNNDRTRDLLSTGDIDYPSRLLRPLLKEAPGLVRFAPKLLKAFF